MGKKWKEMDQTINIEGGLGDVHTRNKDGWTWCKIVQNIMGRLVCIMESKHCC